MQKLALALSFVAVGIAGYAAWSSSAQSKDRFDRIDAELDELRVLETRLSNLEGRVAAPGVTPPKAIDAPAPRATPADGALAVAPGSATAAGATSASATADAAVADLRKRLAAVEERTKDLDTPDGVAHARAGRALAFPNRVVYGSIDEAQTDLDLSPSQRADWDRTLADARRDLDDLRAIPDDEGKTWKQHNEDMMKGLAEGNFRLDLGKMMAMRGKKVPGRNETFGEAEARIRTDAKRRLRDALTPDQQKKMDQAFVDPLLGGGGGPMVSFSVVGPGEDAGMK